MPRRREVPKRKIIPDPKYGDRMVAKFMNVLMYDGKKSVAEVILYRAFDLINERQTGDDALRAFKKAIDNVKPMVEVKGKRVGGASIPVPVEVRAGRGTALALRWIILAARARSERTMAERLSAEFIDAANNRGAAVKKREDSHKNAEANRAFSHYR